ncbi:MAG: hypothetical protein HC821_05090 [Lewinella sp.]|nr:hypothetical protein [Lewinella sp.]
MGYSIGYRRLLAVHLWQHYWLDGESSGVGGSPVGEPLRFPLEGNLASVQQRLRNYDVRQTLSLVPTERSRRQMVAKGLRAKMSNTGLVVVSKEDYAETDTAFRLSFVLKVLSGDWMNYTDLGALGPLAGQVFHLSNIGLMPGSRQLLTGGDNGVLRPVHFITKLSRVLRLRVNDPDQAASVEVHHALSSSGEGPLLSISFPAFAERSHYEIDARLLAEGRYRVVSSNLHPTQATEFYMGLEDQVGVLGIIELQLTGWPSTEYDLVFAKN